MDIELGGDGTEGGGVLDYGGIHQATQSTAAQHIATRSLLDLCEGS